MSLLSAGLGPIQRPSAFNHQMQGTLMQPLPSGCAQYGAIATSSAVNGCQEPPDREVHTLAELPALVRTESKDTLVREEELPEEVQEREKRKQRVHRPALDVAARHPQPSGFPFHPSVEYLPKTNISSPAPRSTCPTTRP